MALCFHLILEYMHINKRNQLQISLLFINFTYVSCLATVPARSKERGFVWNMQDWLYATDCC